MSLHPDCAMATLKLAEELFDAMVRQQREKVLRLAREAVPNLGPEDVLNPNDFPKLKEHPTFDYEDGILAGVVAAQIALRAELRQRFLPPPPGVPGARG